MPRPAETLERLLAELRAVGERLSPLEEACLRALGRRLSTPAAATHTLTDGAYEGRDTELSLRLELRLDAAVSGVLSGDLFDLATDDYLVSFRTLPGQPMDPRDGRWRVVAQDSEGQRTIGLFAMVMAAAGEDPQVLLTLEEGIGGLGTLPVAMAVSWQREPLRILELEEVREQGVEAADPFEVDGRQRSPHSVLAAAGIRLVSDGSPSSIEPRAEGWSEAQLHTLMSDLAASSMDRPGRG